MHDALISAIKEHAHVIHLKSKDYDPIIDAAKTARIVLIGDSTHGTKEFYSERAEITRRLIIEHGFNAVAIEGDWPDAYNIHRYINNFDNTKAEDVLAKFERFPTWMWQNNEVLQFIIWLRAYNNLHKGKFGIGFYGLDLYSMHKSIHEVISYLKKVDKKAAEVAMLRYSCLDSFIKKPQMYTYATYAKLIESCEENIVQQLVDLRRNAFEYLKKDGFVAEDEFFYAEQNAKLVKDAEEYYRSLYRGEDSSWNLRDKHMAQTLYDIIKYTSAKSWHPTKIVLWAHNSHIGDARATEMSQRHEVNLGQLVRQKYGDEALLIGFSTYEGQVTAASNWGETPENKDLLPALPNSHSDIFHRAELGNFILNLREKNKATEILKQPLLQRFVGVIYHPETELLSHYFHASLTKQFDFFVHIDNTNALEAITAIPKLETEELEETYPTGL